MYVIYSDGSPIYSPNLISHGYAITSGKITKELNKAGSLEFIIPPTNPMYSGFSKLKSIITVEDYGEEIWRGRVLDETIDFYKNKKVLCEGELAFLNDVLIQPHSATNFSPKQYFKNVMSIYKANCSDYRMIEEGEFVISDEDEDATISMNSSEYSDALSCLEQNLVGQLEGYLILTRSEGKTYLNYYDKLDDRVSDQVIEFGKTLINFEEYINAAEVYTYLIPLGDRSSGDNRVNISSVNGGKNYIYSAEAEALFGKIWKANVFDGVTSPSKLLSKGKKELEKIIEAATTITINAVDLKDLGVDVSRIDIGWNVKVISIPHNVSSNALCSKIVLDLADRANNEYTLGMDLKTLSDRQSAAFKKSNQSYQIADYVSKSSSDYRKTTDETLIYLDERIKALEEKQGV